MPHFWVHKKIHWSDTDAAGIAWFPNYFGWFEDAEEELYAACDRLLTDPEKAAEMGRHGCRVVTAHQGTTARIVQDIVSILSAK